MTFGWFEKKKKQKPKIWLHPEPKSGVKHTRVLCVLETVNYWHIVGWLLGFNLPSMARKTEQRRPRPVSTEWSPLSVTDWHPRINTLVARYAGDCAYEWACGYVFTPPRCSVIPSDSDCLTGGSLFSETQSACPWFMRGRSDGRARGEKTYINMHKHSITYHSVMVEIHTDHMSLTLFTTLLMLQWKWTAACISLMSLTSARHVCASWTKRNTHMLQRWHTRTMFTAQLVFVRAVELRAHVYRGDITSRERSRTSRRKEIEWFVLTMEKWKGTLFWRSLAHVKLLGALWKLTWHTWARRVREVIRHTGLRPLPQLWPLL